MGVFSEAIVGTLTTATPLLLGALGENVVQKAGVVNVGLEGMMLTGALAAVVATQISGNPYLGVAVAAGAGVLTALLFALFAVKLSANQIVVGVVINLMALGLTGTINRALYGKQTGFQTVSSFTHLFPSGLNLLNPLVLQAGP